MKLDIDNIRKEGQSIVDIKFALDPYSVEFYGDTVNIISPVNVIGNLYIVDHKLYINLKIETNMQTNCDRCLESFTYPFNSNIDAEIIDEKLFDQERDNEVDEDIIYYEDNLLDLEKLIKQHIIMNIPIKVVCDETCQGLCIKCGVKLESNSCNCSNMQSSEDDIDPRLAKLKVLLQQEQD